MSEAYSRSPTTTRPTTRRPVESLAREFVRFADHDCPREPVYEAICRAVAERPNELVLLWRAPVEQQKANLFLASIHDVVLGRTGHPLERYFPSVGGTRPVDSGFESALVDFLSVHKDEVVARIASKSTQTNEIGRAAVLYPSLAAIAHTAGVRRIALLDFGASAGLNLGVDRYVYDYGRFQVGPADDDTAPRIPCELRGAGVPRFDPFPSIEWRMGLDVTPVDVRDEQAVRWLRACIWPSDPVRAARFDRAVTVARRDPPEIRSADEGIASIEAFVESAPRGALPVVFHSWVAYYFDAAERERFGRSMASLADRTGAVWLAAEGETVRLGDRAPWPSTGSPSTTYWVARARGCETLLARSHPHGTYLEWLAGAMD